MEEIIYKVSQLNSYIHDIFIAEEMLHNIVICGEISGYKISGRHAYFTLKDKEAAIACSCFNYTKTYIPKEGDMILAKGSVDYYAVGGKLSFVVAEIKPYGIGALAIQLEKLKAKLLSEGYFAEERKKSIPTFCKRVCVITSKTGAVIRDIISTTRKINKSIDLIVRDTRVQGVGADKDLIQAIQEVDKLNFDTIIIARGGGSFEDLMPFNSEQLVYAIYNAKTPIISAVGHETDFTLCDFASDKRALTPTAAAQIIAFDEEKIKQNLLDTQARLSASLTQKMKNEFNNLNIIQHRLKSSFGVYYSKNYNKIELFLEKIGNLANNCLLNKELILKQLIGKLDANNPTRIFNKGYLFAQKDKNKIDSIKALSVGDKIKLKGKDGQAIAKIEEVTL